VTIAIYPGSFDPVTNGHLDIVQRASRLFDQVIMAVYDGPSKKQRLFNIEERVAFLEEATKHIPQVKIQAFNNLTVEFAKQVGASVIVRGLRAASDFEYESQIAQIYQTLEPSIDVVLFMAGHQYTFFSSSMVKEIASLNGDVSWLVPAHVLPALYKAYGTKPNTDKSKSAGSQNE
jgi:pantetheine-phosphate adenylyltransferase